MQRNICLQARWIIDTTLRYDRTVWKSISTPRRWDLVSRWLWWIDAFKRIRQLDLRQSRSRDHQISSNQQTAELSFYTSQWKCFNRVLNRFDLHLIIFDPSLRSQSFQRWPASHVVSCVLRCPKSLRKPPDMLSLVNTEYAKKTCNGHGTHHFL